MTTSLARNEQRASATARETIRGGNTEQTASPIPSHPLGLGIWRLRAQWFAAEDFFQRDAEDVGHAEGYG